MVDRENELLALSAEERLHSPSPSDERTDLSLLPASSVDDGGSACEISIAKSVPTGKSAKYRLSESRTTAPNYLSLALFVTLCNCPFGCVAILFAILSKRQHLSGDIDGARRKGSISKWLSIIGITSTLLLIIILLVYKFVIVPNTVVDLKALANQLHPTWIRI